MTTQLDAVVACACGMLDSAAQRLRQDAALLLELEQAREQAVSEARTLAEQCARYRAALETALKSMELARSTPFQLGDVLRDGEMVVRAALRAEATP